MWGRHARRIAQRMHVGQRTSPPPPAPPSRGMGCSHGLSPMWPAVLGAVGSMPRRGARRKPRDDERCWRWMQISGRSARYVYPLIWALYEYPRALLARFCVQPAAVKVLPQKSTSTEHTHP